MVDAPSGLPAAVQYKNLLYDFYGGLLTEKQRAFYTLHYMEDLSLSEIGARFGITPQAVGDLLKRVNGLLESYEGTMELVKKWRTQREVRQRLHALLDDLARQKPDADSRPLLEQIRNGVDALIL